MQIVREYDLTTVVIDIYDIAKLLRGEGIFIEDGTILKNKEAMNERECREEV